MTKNTYTRRHFTKILAASSLSMVGATGCSIDKICCVSKKHTFCSYTRYLDGILAFPDRYRWTTHFKNCIKWARGELGACSKHYAVSDLQKVRTGLGTTYNVWAEYTPPAKKAASNYRTYTVCAHLDSVKRGYEAANDNAAGAAAVIELADRLSWRIPYAKHAVRFVLFGGEEGALWGSSYYTRELYGRMAKEEKERHRVINVDTVAGIKNSDFAPDYFLEFRSDLGPSDEFAAGLFEHSGDLTVLGTDLRTGWVLRQTYKDPPKPPEFRDSDLTSDQISFYNHEVPAVSITQYDPYAAIHKEGDRREMVSIPRALSVVDWIESYLTNEICSA